MDVNVCRTPYSEAGANPPSPLRGVRSPRAPPPGASGEKKGRVFVINTFPLSMPLDLLEGRFTHGWDWGAGDFSGADLSPPGAMIGTGPRAASLRQRRQRRNATPSMPGGSPPGVPWGYRGLAPPPATIAAKQRRQGAAMPEGGVGAVGVGIAAPAAAVIVATL